MEMFKNDLWVKKGYRGKSISSYLFFKCASLSSGDLIKQAQLS